MNKAYKPSWFLRNPHAHTLWGPFIRKKATLNLMKQRLETADGDFFDIALNEIKPGQPIVIMLHGWEGDMSSHYVGHTLNKLQAQGFAVVFNSFRGCSGEINRLPQSYHFGWTQDFDFLTHYLRDKHPSSRLHAIGVSLGASVLLNYLAENDNPLSSAIAVSTSFELRNTVSQLTKGFSRFYQRDFISTLKNKYIQKATLIEMPIAASELGKIKNFFVWDDVITAPLYNFNSGEDYYQHCSPRAKLKKITTPTLLIHAKDDPMMTIDVIPDLSELSSSTELLLTKRGGHVGFVEGVLPGSINYYLEDRILEYLEMSNDNNQ